VIVYRTPALYRDTNPIWQPERMLPSVLSGVRDLRSALIVGYTWLIGLWLAVTNGWPSVADLRGHASQGLLVLADLFGQAGSVAAVTVAALVLGQLWIASVNWAVTSLSRRLIAAGELSTAQKRALYFFKPLTGRARDRLLRRTQASFAGLGTSGSPTPDPATPDHAALQQRAALVFSESLLMAPRLIVAKPELYEEHKRLRQDADLLYSLLIPLPLLAVALLGALGAGPLAWAVGIPLLIAAEILLLAQAAHQFKNAMSMLAHFVADGLITTPGLTEHII
jgi:hypothetical protein